MKKIVFSLCLALILPFGLSADEGMWLPMLLKKYNEADMQKKGFKLTAEDLYSVNHASLKDAIVQFGRGCTGELISSEGLLLTNHHCGYPQIQAHSSLEHNYLEYGFWAKSKGEELPNPGLTVKILVYMDDVSQRVLESISDETSESDRIKLVDERCKQLAKEAETEKGYTAIVKPIYYGNQYIRFVYEEFTDVRLVGTPPDAIGKFGGDSDNWMWPRHNADFSVFRVYAGKDNKPAPYSAGNVPYKPKKYFQISLNGYNEKDFTFIYGFPGTTQEYITSYAVEMLMKANPHKIALRDQRLEIIGADMAADQSVRIKYASKQASIANAWKKWQGELKGLDRLNAVAKKQQYEQQFTAWANADSQRGKVYGTVLSQLRGVYAEMSDLSLVNDYYREAVMSVELINFCAQLDKLMEEKDAKKLQENTKAFKEAVAVVFFKDYNLSTDKKIFVAMFNSFNRNITREYQPDYYAQQLSSYGGNVGNMTDKLYAESKLLNQDYVLRALDEGRLDELKDDAAFRLYSAFKTTLDKDISDKLKAFNERVALLQRTYMRGMMEMQPNRKFYPDANSTLRVAYGRVEGFTPVDGERYLPNTTLKGIMEKSLLPNEDYKVPERLKELYKKGDYGRYANSREQLPVAFIATNHTTGGNSGSPILNAQGQLIGINFDRCWESTMSDIMFDPDYCRNISADIRYILFVIDKYAGAKHLVDEMTIVGKK